MKTILETDFMTDPLSQTGHFRLATSTGHLDVYMDGFPTLKSGDPFLVCFSGAVTDRLNSEPPYFSGLGVARDLSRPILAIADPTVSDHATVSLAWYAGNSRFMDLPQMICRAIERLCEITGARPILFGGSGGGFAALIQCQLLSVDVTAIVWNPQTHIGGYVPSAIFAYLVAAFPDLADQIAQAADCQGVEQKERICGLLSRVGIMHSLMDARTHDRASILYLQNRNDWHIDAHAKPYLLQHEWIRLGKNAFSAGSRLALHVGRWGADHEPPPREIILQVLSMAVGGYPVTCIARELSMVSAPASYCQFFSVDGVGDTYKPGYSWVSGDSGECVGIRIEVDGVPVVEDMEYALYLIKDGKVIHQLWYQPSPVFDVFMHARDFDAINVFVRDAFKTVRNAYYVLSAGDADAP